MRCCVFGGDCVWWEGVYLGDVLEYKDEGVRFWRCWWELEAGRGCVT